MTHCHNGGMGVSIIQQCTEESEVGITFITNLKFPIVKQLKLLDLFVADFMCSLYMLYTG